MHLKKALEIANYVVNYYHKYGRKKTIEEVVKFYEKEYPQDFMVHLKQIEIFKNAQLKKTGADKENELRHALWLPHQITSLLSAILRNPRFLQEKKELRWFMERFPEFRVCQKI